MGSDIVGGAVSWRWLGAAAVGITFTLIGAVASSFSADLDKMDRRATQLEQTDAQTNGRLGRIESDVQHLRETTDQTSQDVREIRRLLEGDRVQWGIDARRAR